MSRKLVMSDHTTLAGIGALVGDPGRARMLAALRAARTCYDHLAGRLAVGLADAMSSRGHLEITPDGGLVTRAGAAFLLDFGIDLAAAAPSRRALCRTCLDWSE